MSVLVVGAGPAGLMTAITLARQGVDVLLAERRTELSGLPRATVVSLRSMELLRSFGLESAVLVGAVDVEWTQWRCATLAQAADGVAAPIGMPTRAEGALLSPAAPACVAQDHLEPVLLAHLRSLDGAHVALGTSVVAVQAADDGARVELRDAAGARRTIAARYVVAADGAHSAVRSALGIAMRGPDAIAEATSAVFRAPLWDLVGERRHALYAVTHPEADGVFLPAGPGDRWIYGTIAPVGAGPAATADEAALARRIGAGVGTASVRPRIEQVGRFRFAAQVAERYRQGCVFLVGDAAHRATPRGGTGMNTALHDGHDLGWKLAWVLRGWATGGLLDSYEAERRPVAEHNVARSAQPDGTGAAAADELHADLGGRLKHVWVDAGVSTLDLLGPGLTRFAGPGWVDDEPASELAGPPVALRRLDAFPARALGLHAGDALLVRPDGVPVDLRAHRPTREVALAR